jgi:hypothetical protein
MVILRREGWRVNPKRIYRLYTEDGLTVGVCIARIVRKFIPNAGLPKGLAAAGS